MNLPFFLFERKRFDFSGKIKKISILSFLASVRALWVERALRKYGPKGQKVKKAGKKLAVWGWAFGGSKMAGNHKNRIFGKSKVGAFI